ncbi:MAG: serine hydrolase [Oscillospiraceae bacterium]|nr:serine hydrolase [Oscillospiraceae bacterium]
MDIVSQGKAVKLIGRLLDMTSCTQPIIKTAPQKPAVDPRPLRAPLPRATPESVGVPGGRLRAFLRALDEDRRIDMHGVMILRGGKVICEGSFGAYRGDTWHTTFSMCKSITCLAVGILVDDGLLSTDERLADIFKSRARRLNIAMMKNITVEHLLTMSTGVLFNEAGAMTETDWVKSFLESGRKFEAGKDFSYNSLNTYMLSAIVREKTGKSLSAFLNERLFGPMGIEQYFWETCPKGIERGGWGLYLRMEDAAKLGQLVLDYGVWNGRQLVSREWIERASHTRIKPPDNLGDFDYGYQMWTQRDRDAFLFNGMFGQNVIGYRGTGIVVVSYAGNNEFFQLSDYFKALGRYFGPDFRPSDKPLLPNPIGDMRLRRTEKRLGTAFYEKRFSAPARRRACEALNGVSYSFLHRETAGVGLMPLMLQGVQNNYTKGVDAVAFSARADGFFVLVEEGGETREFRVGFGAPAYTDVSFAGEPYRVGTTGRFSRDEDGAPVLILRFSFIETAHTRILKVFYADGERARFEFSERPGRAYVQLSLETTFGERRTNRLLEPILGKAEADILDYRLRIAFEPEATGRRHEKQD